MDSAGAGREPRTKEVPPAAGSTLQVTFAHTLSDEADFCRLLDTELFPQLDGTPMHGPGGFTSQSMRDAWHKRVQQGLP